MTTFPSSPIDDDTFDLLSLISDDPRKSSDWDKFEAAVRTVAAAHAGKVSPNWVREELSNSHGLTINPRLYSSFWPKACRAGLLRFEGEWSTNDDRKGRNSGKPSKVYAWVGGAL